ncbi:MAG: hypothetical protein AAB599_02760 [Patescibacteria group bacterium]
MATPGGGYYGVSVHLAFKRPLKTPREPIREDNININRSFVHGPVQTHVVTAVVEELSDVMAALTKTSSPALN